MRFARNGKAIYVANGKGQGSRANRDGPNPVDPAGEGRSIREYIAGLFQGTLSVILMPGPTQMASYSRTVYECSPLRRGDPTAVRGEQMPPGHPIPGRVGDPSPIKYVVYIIKENRTYDQVFGDLPEGKGDPHLCLFPEAITPNHHALAREFVLLDNFYVDGEVSADGHEWTMGAYATDFVDAPGRYLPRQSAGSLSLGGRIRPGQAGGGLPLGPRGRKGSQLSQLRRVRQERQDSE